LAVSLRWLAAIGVHGLGYLLVMALIALVVYEKFGLALLRRAWINLDQLWVIALMLSAFLILINLNKTNAMRLLTALLILSLVLGSNSTLPVDSAHAERLKARGTKPPCAEIKFHNLSRYKGQSWSRVFNDREIAPALRALLKGDLGKLKESLKEVYLP